MTGAGHRGGAQREPLVLLVDDDPDVRRLMTMALTGLPVRLEARSTAFGVLNDIAELQPALVLLDVMMAGLDGAGLTEAVRADPQIHATPIVLYSALDPHDLARRAAACGADGYLSKTVGPSGLVSEVRRRLGL